MRPSVRAAAVVVTLLVAAACSADGDATGTDPTEPRPPASAGGADPGAEVDERALLGGDGTVALAGAQAFSQPVRGLSGPDRRAFAVGNSFFNDNWVIAPASTEGRDGLGPLFNAQSCSSCHFRDGRGAPPLDDADPERGLLLRLSVPGESPDGGPLPEPTYGGQLQDRSIPGVAAEGTISITRTAVTGQYADGSAFELERPEYTITGLGYGPLAPDVLVSPRVAPAMMGVGLIEGIPAEDVEAAADPDDADGDGISGRANHVIDTRTGETVLGRFGWKANVPTVEQQTAGAFHGDIGITSELFADQDCTEAEVGCAAAADGGEPELDAQKLGRVTFYSRTLAVPERRAVGEADTDRGEALFGDLGCSGCHTPEQRTGPSDIEALSDQVIRPYTDLLLHDMGEGLADGRPDFEADGQEWRTPPLWGIGLTQAVNGHTRFLHDGRARNLTEAVLWHGGEAQTARDGFVTLDRPDREALVAFLDSL